MIQATMERFRNLIIREKVTKVPNQMEAVRVFNYPYQAIEEAVVNAFYHRDYMSCEPVTIEIEPDCINIMNFPGIDRSISEKTIEEGKRFVSRYYRNRRLGEFFTDDDRRAMRIRIPIHPVFLGKADKEPSTENATITKNETSFETSLKQVLKQSDYDKVYVVIQKLALEKNITIQEVMTLTGKSRTTAWRYMKKLTDIKLVESSGNTNDAVYTVVGA